MKKLTLSEMERILKEHGYDTSNYTIQLNDLKVEVSEEVKEAVDDVQLKHYSFRRWVMAQTMSMLNEGWDNALSRYMDFMYQFKVIQDEYKALAKMQKSNSDELKERELFFTHEVVTATYQYYIKKANKYIKHHKQITEKVKRNEDGDKVITQTEVVKLVIPKISFLGVCKVSEAIAYFEDLDKEISALNDEEKDYVEMYDAIKKINARLVRLPNNTTKCEKWKQAFRGEGAYYTLQNMVSYHNVKMTPGNIDDNLEYLKNVLFKHKNEVWKLHYIMIDVIKKNHFDSWTAWEDDTRYVLLGD